MNDSKIDFRDPEWVAETLGIERNTIYKFLRAGELPGLQLGRKWLVSESALASFLHKKLLEQTDSRKTATTAWLDKIVKIGASFTPRASRTLSFTHDEAVNCGHDYIGTEHLLLAINDVPQSVASKALAGMSVDAQALRKKILARVGTGNADGSETLQPTPRLLKVIKSSLKSSVRKKAHYVGAEDLLLALVEEKKGPAAQVLSDLGVTTEDLQAAIAEVLKEGKVLVAPQ